MVCLTLSFLFHYFSYLLSEICLIMSLWNTRLFTSLTLHHPHLPDAWSLQHLLTNNYFISLQKKQSHITTITTYILHQILHVWHNHLFNKTALVVSVCMCVCGWRVLQVSIHPRIIQAMSHAHILLTPVASSRDLIGCWVHTCSASKQRHMPRCV